MFKIFKKKKLNEQLVSRLFVNRLLEMVDEGFGDVVEAINEAPEFVKSPEITKTESQKFLFIALAGNLLLIPRHLPAHVDNRITNAIINELCIVFQRDKDKIQQLINNYQSFLSKVNHPSDNILYGMSKSIFYKYELAAFQEEYFRNMNAPNPLLLKRLDEVVEHFVFDWKDLSDQYQIS